MKYTTVITSEQLYAHLGDENWAILDSRYDLERSRWGEEQYLREHVPGAVYVDLDHSLSAPKDGTNGRHPLPDLETITAYFSELGIDEDTQVIAYDARGGGIAARVWWMLNYLGHEGVAVLDGGFPEWKRLGLPVRSQRETRSRREFTPRVNPDFKVNSAEVLEEVSRPSNLLVDSRAPERYRGEEEPFDPIAGRIPGAVNRFWQANLNDSGRFRNPEILREEFENILGSFSPEETIIYCGSGVTGCHNVLSMAFAGLPGARLYAGSWSEWSSDPNRPIASGPAPP
jgi:thiosulfate/3-mercaptopyruvate sulfurtransferase